MSKKNGWVAIDKMMAQEFKHINRSFSRIEAMFPYSVDENCGRKNSIKGYAERWGWSRNKVRKFLSEVRTPKGHFVDSKGTGKGHLDQRTIDRLKEGGGFSMTFNGDSYRR